jgi:transcriptional regulator with XRE-family HTH domain
MANSSAKNNLTYVAANALEALGQRIDEARRLRGETAEQFATRIGVSRSTYHRLTKGDAGVAMGVLAQAILSLGLIEQLEELCNPKHDPIMMAKLRSKIPKRVNPAVEDEF